MSKISRIQEVAIIIRVVIGRVRQELIVAVGVVAVAKKSRLLVR